MCRCTVTYSFKKFVVLKANLTCLFMYAIVPTYAEENIR